MNGCLEENWNSVIRRKRGYILDKQPEVSTTGGNLFQCFCWVDLCRDLTVFLTFLTGDTLESSLQAHYFPSG